MKYSTLILNLISKQFAINLLEDYMGQAADNTLTSPSTNAGFYSYYDSTAAGDYTKATIQRSIRYGFNIIREQLSVDTCYYHHSSQWY